MEKPIGIVKRSAFISAYFSFTPAISPSLVSSLLFRLDLWESIGGLIRESVTLVNPPCYVPSMRNQQRTNTRLPAPKHTKTIASKVQTAPHAHSAKRPVWRWWEEKGFFGNHCLCQSTKWSYPFSEATGIAWWQPSPWYHPNKTNNVTGIIFVIRKLFDWVHGVWCIIGPLCTNSAALPHYLTWPKPLLQTPTDREPMNSLRRKRGILA